MTPELQRVYDETPDAPPLSRLEPFKDLILRWRRDGRSFPAICKLLGKQGVPITKEPLRQYVQRRTRRSKKTPAPEVTTPTLAPIASSVPVRPKRSAEEIAAMRDAAKASNHKPSFAREEHQELFVFDEDKPLTNQPKGSN
jgi:hypothetical protein